MIRVRGRALRGALALMAASGIWLVAGAPAADAYVCAFDIQSPGEGSVSGSPVVPFRGTFEVTPGLADGVLEVAFTSAPGPLPPPTVSRRSAIDLTGSYDVPVGPLSHNGAYTARVTAVHAGTAPVLNCDEGLGPERRDTEASATVRFKVSVQASPPRNVTARFDAGARTAIVTWERSGDPDIVGYSIGRQVGTAPATRVSVGAGPLTWTDTDLPSGQATITYSVQAFRQGPDPGTTSLPSAPVAAAPLAVPAPGGPAPAPAPSTPTGPPGGPAPPAGGATATTAPFTLGPPVGGDAPPPRSIPFLPSRGLGFPQSSPTTGPDGQGGYQPLIPYSEGGWGGASLPKNGGGDDDQALAGRGSRGGERGDGTPGLAYVASGLLSSVVAAHILWLRRQALRPELAGTGGRHELETVTPPDPEPPALAPPPVVEGASPFEPVREEVPAGGSGESEATAGRRPLRAVREPAAAGVAAAAGAILRPARDGSGTFEPVTPSRRSRPRPAAPRPIVVAIPAPEQDVPSVVGRRADDGTDRILPRDLGPDPEVEPEVVSPVGRRVRARPPDVRPDPEVEQDVVSPPGPGADDGTDRVLAPDVAPAPEVEQEVVAPVGRKVRARPSNVGPAPEVEQQVASTVGSRADDGTDRVRPRDVGPDPEVEQEVVSPVGRRVRARPQGVGPAPEVEQEVVSPVGRRVRARPQGVGPDPEVGQEVVSPVGREAGDGTDRVRSADVGPDPEVEQEVVSPVGRGVGDETKRARPPDISPEPEVPAGRPASARSRTRPRSRPRDRAPAGTRGGAPVSSSPDADLMAASAGSPPPDRPRAPAPIDEAVPQARSVGAGSDVAADAPVAPVASAPPASPVVPVVVPEAEGGSEFGDEARSGPQPPSSERAEAAPDGARPEAAAAAPVLSASDHGPPVEPERAERPDPPAPEADREITSPPAAAGTAREPARPRAILRARLGRSRSRSTPWVAAEPVPASPVEPASDEESDPYHRGSSLPQLPGNGARPGEPSRESDASAVPAAGPLGSTSVPVANRADGRSLVAIIDRPHKASVPARPSRVGGTGHPQSDDPGRQTDALPGDRGEAGATEADGAGPRPGGERRYPRPVLILRPKGPKSS